MHPLFHWQARRLALPSVRSLKKSFHLCHIIFRWNDLYIHTFLVPEIQSRPIRTGSIFSRPITFLGAVVLDQIALDQLSLDQSYLTPFLHCWYQPAFLPLFLVDQLFRNSTGIAGKPQNAWLLIFLNFLIGAEQTLYCAMPQKLKGSIYQLDATFQTIIPSFSMTRSYPRLLLHWSSSIYPLLII